MFAELIVATVLTAAPPPPAPPGALPNGGRACLVIDVCDPRPCILPAARRRAPDRCASRRVPPRPRVIPARG